MSDKTEDFLAFYDNGDDTSTEDTTPEEASSEEATSEEASSESSSEEVAPPEPEELSKESKGLLAKAQDEKKKRQDLEKQLDEMKAQIEKLAQSKQPEAEAPKITEPDTLDEAYTPYIKSLISNEVTKVKTELSREQALEKWGDDFIEAEKFFMDHANEADIANALKASNPAKYVFETVKKHKDQQKLQDPDYVKKLEAEIREKVLKELQGEIPKTKLESKSILGKGSVAVKDSNEQPVDVFEMYNKESAF
jgi:hypothetical protein